MKSIVHYGLLSLCLAATNVRADDAELRSSVAAAIKKLNSQNSYAWQSVVEPAQSGGRFGGGRSETGGEVQGGLRYVQSTTGGGYEFASRGGQFAVFRDGNWMTLEQAAGRPSEGGPFNPEMVTGFVMPGAEAEALLGQVSGFTRSGNQISGELSEAVATEQLSGAGPRFGRRRPAISNAAGAVDFTIENGVLTAWKLSLQGSMEFFGRTRVMDRVTTTTVSGLGATEIDLDADTAEILDALSSGRAPNVFVPEPGFQKLFNGRDLTGWAGRANLWSVRDGAITGQSTVANPVTRNTFLIAKEGDANLEVDDFELRFVYRILANNDRGFGNSGMQYRSVDKGDYSVAGYQGDFEAGTRYSGILYDEGGGAGGRGIMAERGQSVSWSADGEKRVTGELEKSEVIQASIKANDWNEYRIVARGNHLQHFINGHQTVDVLDETEGKRLSKGILALQLHAGDPMTVQCKDIQIKSLSGADQNAAGNVRVADGFKLELIYSVPKDTQGSWVAMCFDPQGRIIASDQNGQLYRMTPPPVGQGAAVEPEPIDLDIGGAHGLLYAFDSLYVMVNEGRRTHGFYRVRDTDGDDQFDHVELLREIDGGGEHGLHAIVLSPDGKSLYLSCGNQSRLPEVDSSVVPLHWSEDHLLPRLETRFMAGVLAPGGYILKTDPDGKQFELVASGFRNQFDIAFNREGELFTYDADMEWDVGDPWYRPTRVNHVISGAEFGWRNGAGKWPDYYFDSFGSVVDIGTGSPTGIGFGYGAKFPSKYQDALYIADWSFGKLYALHLNPAGGSYEADYEEFISGQPFPITDVLISPTDGAMYVSVGGRQTQSGVYRVTYVGTESTAPVTSTGETLAYGDLRRELESFHGRTSPRAVETAWPHLASEDRAVRHAARIAIEWQDPSTWSERALSETNPRSAMAAMAALARSTSRDEFHRKPGDAPRDAGLQGRMVATLGRIQWESLNTMERVDLMRAYSLIFTRQGVPSEAVRLELIAKFEPLFPANDRRLNRMLANMLVYLQAPGAAEKIMALLRTAPTQEEQIDYVMALRVLRDGWTMPLREEYFRWFTEVASAYRGGNTFGSSLESMKQEAVETLSESEKVALKEIIEARPERKTLTDILAAREFVKEWTVDELVPLVEQGIAARKRDFNNGRRAYGAVACGACHRFAQDGGLVGPDLTTVSGRFGVRDLLESIVEPNKAISDQYAMIRIFKKDGDIVSGRIANLSGSGVSVVENMFDPGNMTNVNRADIDSMELSEISMMPQGLLNSLSAGDIQDLVAFLLSQGDSEHAVFQ